MSALIERLAQHYLVQHPNDAARALEGLAAAEAAAALATLSGPQRARVLSAMTSVQGASALAALGDAPARDTLLATDPVQAARWLALLREGPRERLRGLLPEREARALADAIDYPPGTAGALMDAGVLAIAPETAISAVIAALRHMPDRRVIDVMVCDDDRHLIGIVPVQALLVADPDATVEGLLQETPALTPMTERDEVVELLERTRLASLPVVDVERRLLGVIRHDALVRAVQADAASDLSKMVGAALEERALSSPVLTVRSRLPWLLVNLATAFAAAFVVGLFDATIAEMTALAVLLPVVAGQSGNTGAQALAVTARGLSLRELRTPQWMRVVRKEIVAAVFNGAVVATVTAAAVYAWSQNLGLCAVIAISMVVSMALAAISGAVVPIGLTALGRDPATASSIVLTTITDITGFFSFLGLATLLRGWMT